MKPSELTVVTGIFDINRDSLEDSFRRPFSHYTENFVKLLQLENPMCIYIESKYEHLVWEHRSHENTRVCIKELDELQNGFPFYDQVQKLRTDETWRNQAGWLAESTQANLALYNPLVMSKFFFLHDQTIFNHFQTDYFVWIDGGLTNTVHEGYFTHDKVLEHIDEHLKKLLFLCFPYVGNTEIHGFERETMAQYCRTEYVDRVARGGFFGGHKSYIQKLNGTYYQLLNDSLSRGFMGTEECIFTMLTYLFPNDVNRFMIEDNGLLSTFFEAVKLKSLATEKSTETSTQNPNSEADETTDPEAVIAASEIKTSERKTLAKTDKKLPALYVITYNSPEQLRMLLETFLLTEPELITQTEKFLINNSTKEETFLEYDLLCEQFGFEQIREGNIGICGGRQFAADHFAASLSPFMFFFEDDMLLHEAIPDVCRNGFTTYVPGLFRKSLEIMEREKFDFLKLSFTEFYGDNKTQWAWYNLPDDKRELYFGKGLVITGIDEIVPRTQFTEIATHEGLSYIKGDIYYCNWPQIVSKAGNQKMFLDTRWESPYEQTWMSHLYQLTRQGKLQAGLLLASPVNHNRVYHYTAEERREH